LLARLQGWTANPSGALGYSLKNCFCARVAEVTQAKIHRIGSARHGKFVHERLIGESVLRRAQAPES
jgi:hypothetical protein